MGAGSPPHSGLDILIGTLLGVDWVRVWSRRQSPGGVKATTGVRDGCKQRADFCFVSGQTFPICAIPTSDLISLISVPFV